MSAAARLAFQAVEADEARERARKLLEESRDKGYVAWMGLRNVILGLIAHDANVANDAYQRRMVLPLIDAIAEVVVALLGYLSAKKRADAAREVGAPPRAGHAD